MLLAIGWFIAFSAVVTGFSFLLSKIKYYHWYSLPVFLIGGTISMAMFAAAYISVLKLWC